MKIDAWASESQYLAHLLPIWEALPDAARGDLFLPRRLTAKVTTDGVPHRVMRPDYDAGGPVLVASFQDGRSIGVRGYIYVEHGAGQSYTGGDPAVARHGSYAGGAEHDRCVLFLCPNETAAARWRARYPSTPAVAVGCPKLDRYENRHEIRANVTPTVAISFHADIRLCPETRWAFPHFRSALPGLRAWCEEQGGQLIGHGHPRAFSRLAKIYGEVGIEAVEDFAEVLDRAQVYAIDNSSTAFEAMAVGIPVVWMNSPTYRRDVSHGLRFWTHADAGVQVDEPGALVGAVGTALADPPEQRRRREAAVRAVYGEMDGRASRRAADAICEVLSATIPA